ncbi:hypothetical protein Tco_0488355 [Tanacetum coccineum]
MFEDNSYQAHEDHKNLYEALQKSLELDYSNQLPADLDEARKKKRKKHDSPRTPSGSPPQPPSPPPLAGASGDPCTSGASGSFLLPPPPPPPSTGTSRGNQRQGSGAPSSSKTAVSTPEISNKSATLKPPNDTLMHDDDILDIHVHLSDDEVARDDHQPTADIRNDWWKPLPEAERPASLEPAWTILSSNMIDVENNWATALASTYVPPAENSLLAKTVDMTTFMNWYCQQVNKTVLTQADLEGQAYEVIKAFHLDVVHLQPLPLADSPCHVTVQTQFFFNKDLEYLRYGNKGSRPTLSISKMKVARYPDLGLKLLVPKEMWIFDVCTYDISASYGINHWWYNRQKFYIERHAVASRHKKVKTHMRILRNRVKTSAVRITMMIAGIGIKESHHGPSDALHNPP